MSIRCERCKKVLGDGEGSFIDIEFKPDSSADKSMSREVCVCQDCLKEVREMNIQKFNTKIKDY